MQWSEDSTNGSTLHERIQQYMALGVNKHFGLSLTEFLDLPPDIVSYILELSANRQKTEGTMTQDLLNGLDR